MITWQCERKTGSSSVDLPEPTTEFEEFLGDTLRRAILTGSAAYSASVPHFQIQ